MLKLKRAFLTTLVAAAALTGNAAKHAISASTYPFVFGSAVSFPAVLAAAI